jgi:hypothetical protein
VYAPEIVETNRLCPPAYDEPHSEIVIVLSSAFSGKYFKKNVI